MLLGDLAILLAQTLNLKNILDFDDIIRYIMLVIGVDRGHLKNPCFVGCPPAGIRGFEDIL